MKMFCVVVFGIVVLLLVLLLGCVIDFNIGE